MNRIILLATALILFVDCNSFSVKEQKGNEPVTEDSATQITPVIKSSVKDSATERKKDSSAKTKNDLSNVEHLIGFWFMPHAAVINIQFNRNGRFVFNDYNMILKKDEKLEGNFQLNNGTLTLLYDDRPRQSFKFYKGEKGDENYYIKKSGYYFVKGENGYSNDN